MKLIVGLGNPGAQYRQTRHNVGWDVVDALTAHLGLGDFDSAARSDFQSLALSAPIELGSGMDKLLLLKPQTYMNLSGQAVQAASAYYKIPLVDMMVVLDDIALPCGAVRMRPSGSSGGHNGLRDIEARLSSQQYPRLRLGIDPPPASFVQKNYVLGKFTEDQRPKVDEAIAASVKALLCWVEHGVQKAMSLYNTTGTEQKNKKDAEKKPQASEESS